MESIIKVVEGKELREGSCMFCGKTANKLFGTIKLDENRHNGSLFRNFHICDKHLKCLNTLLSGENNIDDLIIFYETNKNTKFNLRF